MIARQEPGEPAPRAGREHHRVAVEFLGAIDKCTVPRTEQHREFRWYFHKARCPVKLSSRTVEQDVVPHARASGPARNPPQRPLQLHHDHDRQTRPVSLSQQVGCDDRLISLRCALVGDKKMLVCNVAQRSGEGASGRCSTDAERAAQPKPVTELVRGYLSFSLAQPPKPTRNLGLTERRTPPAPAAPTGSVYTVACGAKQAR